MRISVRVLPSSSTVESNFKINDATTTIVHHDISKFLNKFSLFFFVFFQFLNVTITNAMVKCQSFRGASCVLIKLLTIASQALLSSVLLLTAVYNQSQQNKYLNYDVA